MRIAAGFKAHSGWAALVVIGALDDGFHVIDRRRIELVDPADIDWAKQLLLKNVREQGRT